MPSSAEPFPSALVVEHARLREIPEVGGWLAPAEVAVAGSFRMEARRRSWILGRWAAKRAAMRLADALPDADPRRWAILSAPDGAPDVFLDGVPHSVSLSLSHRAGLALAVAASHPLVVGCDLERVEPRTKAFIDDYFVESERAFVRAVPEGRDRDVRANLVWCVKEAALKVVRSGLRRDTRSMIGTIGGLDEGAEWNRFDVLDTSDSTSFRGWWRLTGEFVETVALRHDPRDR